MKQAEMKYLIVKLDNENRNLSKFVEGIEKIHEIESRIPSQSAEARKLAQLFHQFRDSADALDQALARGWSSGCHDIHHTMLFLQPYQTLTPTKSRSGSRTQSHCELTILLARGSTNTNPVPAWLPLKFTINGEADRPSGDARQEVNNICSTLVQDPQSEHTLLFHLTQGMKLLNGGSATSPTPETVATGCQLPDLEALLQGTEKLDWEERTILALSLACCLVQFHSTAWTCESWTKRVIRLFRNPTHSQRDRRCQPLIPRTFSRESNPSRHQSVEHDLLELGILFLEIWEQRTLESWVGRSVEDSYYPRMIAALEWLKERRGYITPTYSDAVSVCVKFSFEGVQHGWENPNFRRAVCEKVIAPLRENCSAWVRND